MFCFALVFMLCNLATGLNAAPMPACAGYELLELLLEYCDVIHLGPEDPTVIKLRTQIDEKIKAGESVERELVVVALDEWRKGVPKKGADFQQRKTIAGIATLTELLAHEPEYFAKNVDAVAKVKDDWISGILYVPSGRLSGEVHDVKPDATEITIPKGAADGLKVGMHLHLYYWQLARSRLDGKSFVLGQVASTKPTESQIKLVTAPSKPLPSTLYFTQPSFRVGSLILTIRFDEDAWLQRPLMNAFLGDLQHSCSRVTYTLEDSILGLAKPNILVVDTPRTDCQIDVLPIGPMGFNSDQMRTLRAVEKFVKEQPYFTNMKLNSPPLSKPPKAAEPVKPNAPGASKTSASSEPELPSSNLASLSQSLRNWQDRALEGVSSEALPELLSRLRNDADEAEKNSLAKATTIRDMLAAKPPKPAEEVEKLKVELRAAVEEAFTLRHRMKTMEFASLTMQVQATMDKLIDRDKTRKEIVDRRVDDLLNPNLRWDSASQTKGSAATSQVAILSNRGIGWQTDPKDGARELLLQIPTDKTKSSESGEYKAIVPNELKGHYSRIVVQFGSNELPRTPTIEELGHLPVPRGLAASTLAENADYAWSMDSKGESQVTITLSAEKQEKMKQGKLENILNLPGSVALQASSVVVRLDSSIIGEVTFRGKPMPGNIELISGPTKYSATIGESGKFQIDSLPPGRYSVSIATDSKLVESEILKLKGKSVPPKDIEVLPGKNKVEIRRGNVDDR